MGSFLQNRWVIPIYRENKALGRWMHSFESFQIKMGGYYETAQSLRGKRFFGKGV